MGVGDVQFSFDAFVIEGQTVVGASVVKNNERVRSLFTFHQQSVKRTDSVRRLSRAGTIWIPVLLLLVFFQIALANEPPFYQRCFGEGTDTNISRYESPDWLESSCQPCGKTQRRAAVSENSFRSLHVIIQLTTPRLQSELLSIASGLLTENVNVTIFYMNFNRTTTHDYSQILWGKVLSGVPCTQDAANHLRPTLSLQGINIPPRTMDTCSQNFGRDTHFADPIQSCSVAVATNQYRALTSALFQDKIDPLEMPDLLLTDFHGIGATTFAEKLGIPYIILADEMSYFETIGWGENDVSFWQYIVSLPNAFLRSFFATRTFSELNRMRSVLGLSPVRHLSSLWVLATSIFVLANEYQSSSLPKQREYMPPVMHFSTPIFPPCIACLQNHPPPRHPAIATLPPAKLFPGEPENDSLYVLVYLPVADFTASEAREVLNGLHIVHRSISFTDTDETWCNQESSKICWSAPIDLKVKWLLTDSSNHRFLSQHPLPEFVTQIEAHRYHDHLLRAFQNTTKNDKTILMANCDGDAGSALLLRIPTLCFPSKKVAPLPACLDKGGNSALRTLSKIESKQIATEIIRFLHTLRTLSPEQTLTSRYDNNEGNSLRRAVTAILEAANLLRSQRITLAPTDFEYNGRRAYLHSRWLQRLFAATIEAKGLRLAPSYTQNTSSTTTVMHWLASSVLCSAAFYLIIRRTFPGAARQLRTSLLNAELRQFKFFVEAFHVHLPEIQSALKALSELFKEHDNLERRQPSGEAVLLRLTNEQHNGKIHQKLSGNKSGHSSHKKRMAKHR